MGTIQEEREARRAELRALGDSIKDLDTQRDEIEKGLQAAPVRSQICPTTALSGAQGEANNVVVRTEGEPRTFDFAPKPHWELGETLGIIDFERGVKLSGSRFYVLQGRGRAAPAGADPLDAGPPHPRARLHRDLPAVHGQARSACRQPASCRSFATTCTATPRTTSGWCRPPRCRVTNIHRDEILDAGGAAACDYVAYTPCFRREKMSAGRDVRGIKRGHQFDKVEMYKFCAPETSDAELDAPAGRRRGCLPRA